MFSSSGIIPYRKQWLAGLSISLLGLTAGAMTLGWPSPYVAQLTAPNCTHRLKLTNLEASWVVSLTAPGLVFGTAFGAIIQEYFGRKKTLLITSVPLILGALLIIVAPIVPWLYASRFISGFAKGIFLSAAALFLGEIADPMIRGSLVILNMISVSVGKLLGSIMGGLLPMETYSYVCIVIIVLFFVSFLLVPESPYYHIRRGDTQMAEDSLNWWSQGQKNSEDVKEEIKKLQDFVQSKSVSVKERFNELKKTQHQKNMLIILCLVVLLSGAGNNTMQSYVEIILRNGKIDLTPSFVVMALSFSEIVAGIVPLVLIDKIGRGALLIGSAIGVTAGHILLGSHFYMLSTGIDPKSISWLPVFSLFLVLFSIPCGLSTGPETLVSELFPPIIKTPTTFIYFATGALTAFIAMKLFLPFVDLVGEQYVFWTFAASALLFAVLSYLYAPKTARMSLVGIQENLKRHNDKFGATQSDKNSGKKSGVEV